MATFRNEGHSIGHSNRHRRQDSRIGTHVSQWYEGNAWLWGHQTQPVLQEELRRHRGRTPSCYRSTEEAYSHLHNLANVGQFLGSPAGQEALREPSSGLGVIPCQHFLQNSRKAHRVWMLPHTTAGGRPPVLGESPRLRSPVCNHLSLCLPSPAHLPEETAQKPLHLSAQLAAAQQPGSVFSFLFRSVSKLRMHYCYQF